MTFGQLIQCNIRNIFLEKPYIKYDGGTSPSPFSGKSKLRLSLDQQPKGSYNLFLLYSRLNTIEYIDTKMQSTVLYLI